MPTIAAQHQQTLPLADIPQTSVRSLRHLSATRLRANSGRARLPALRPRLSPGLPSRLSSRPCFLGLGIKRALPALSCPSPVTAPHASAVVLKGMMPKAAPERVASPRGGTALAPSSESALAGRAVNAIIAPAMSVSAPTGSMRLPLRSHRGLLCCSRVTASNNAATDGTGG
jgi:hypothetical protein